MIRRPDLALLRTALSLFAALALLLPVVAGAAETTLAARGAAGYQGTLQLAAAPLLTMRPTPFSITLTDPAGKPTTAPDLTCDLIMPAMPMPENRPKTTRSADRYEGEAIFTMAGAWRMVVVLTRDGKELDRLNFDIERVLLK